MFKIFSKKQNKGNTLLELVFYIAIFSLTSVLVINSILSLVVSFKHNTVLNNLNNHTKILETISREIKNATSVSSITSTNLQLNGKDSLGNNKTSQFLLSGSNINFYENGVLVGVLNSPNVLVNDLSFVSLNHIRLGENYDAPSIVPLNTSLIKVSITLQSSFFGVSKTETFYNTLVLRGSF